MKIKFNKKKLKIIINKINRENPDSRKLTADYIASKIGYSPMTYNNYINNKVNKFDYLFIKNLADFLEVEEFDFMDKLK